MNKATKEIKSMTIEDLKKRTKDLRLEMIKNNAQVATGTAPKSPGHMKNAKKTIARIFTEIRSRELAKIKGEKKGEGKRE